MVGLRGVGKTVLLNRIFNMAEADGYRAVYLEAHENKSLPALLVPELRKVLFALDAMSGLSEKVKRGLRVLRSFVGGVKVKVNEVEFGLDVDPEKGAADSGDLEADLPELFVALGEAAADRKIGVAIILDELQYLTSEELSALIMAMHRIAQKQLPVVLIGAGLPQLVGLAGKSKSYAERLFDYPELGPLSHQDAAEALQGPVQKEGVQFTAAAIDEIIRVTKGYAYFLQEWGYQAWNIAHASPIDVDVVQEATRQSIARLDSSFFRVRLDRTTPREKTYMRMLAELGPGRQRSGDIAERMGVDVKTVAPLRSGLIKKGMIYSPSHGDTEFTVPLFDEFMKRTIPQVLNPSN
ncbi:AAA family ATPase [Burkholderia ubonensis]|uniref:AAA family ATPase n=2 Tax=Burkholderia ubonensis TaxID=101571 RepID=A0A107G932_9BURK|nr:AAA family ATPase [Burkholderia ubonensis]KWD74598.1 AAA family ATPase [Burkholderia ubonensis]KWD94032.1 AAA family ATPase [Burkholderia ubonensis]KWE07581.1 AAA family ATPase [Burkholderia ubonensis]